jgi:phosphatidylglycerol---prolipoprotein diacylglyceryl transferase
MNHQHPLIDNWGVEPVLFHLGTIPVSSYSFFVSLGIIAGALVYYFEARKQRQVNEHSFLIAVGALAGAALGAKMLEILINVDNIDSLNSLAAFLLSGRTIIGGLIGGTLGAMLTKKILHIQTKKGNLFAPAVALGVAIGRIGCFLNGCCYGQPTKLPWAINFGDGIMRHPTQLYESLFMLAMFIVLKTYYKQKPVKPGYLFKVLMIWYFIFRFLVEFIRVERIAFWHLTYFQIIATFVLLYLALDDIKLLTIKLIENGRKFR